MYIHTCRESLHAQENVSPICAKYTNTHKKNATHNEPHTNAKGKRRSKTKMQRERKRELITVREGTGTGVRERDRE